MGRTLDVVKSEKMSKRYVVKEEEYAETNKNIELLKKQKNELSEHKKLINQKIRLCTDAEQQKEWYTELAECLGCIDSLDTCLFTLYNQKYTTMEPQYPGAKLLYTWDKQGNRIVCDAYAMNFEKNWKKRLHQFIKTEKENLPAFCQKLSTLDLLHMPLEVIKNSIKAVFLGLKGEGKSVSPLLIQLKEFVSEAEASKYSVPTVPTMVMPN